MEKEIENILIKSLKKINIDFNNDFNLVHPQDLKNGDYTTNIAMQLVGKYGKNPREFAQELILQINTQIDQNENIEKVEIAGPGYLNFYLDKTFFKNFINQKGYVLEKENLLRNKKILLEHSSPNLFKPFHIGHMVNNAIGESLVRILKYSGVDVKTASFPSDVSPGIAKTIWALKKENKKPEKLTLAEIANAYVVGSKEYKENEEVKKQVDKINSELYSYLNNGSIQSENIKFYEEGKKLSEKHFLEITKRLGSNFDYIFYESKAEKIGKRIVEKNISKVFQKSDGAVIFEGKNFTNVFINSAGFGTYLAKDLGLLKLKQREFPDIEKSLVVTDIEQKQHFELLKEAGRRVSEVSEFVEKSQYLQHGRMTFVGNKKISSRYGNVPLATELIETVQNNILEKMENRDFSVEEKKEISEKLAIATLKYSILKVTSGKNISFDIEKDTNPQGNSATYLMYSLVRAKSILRKVEIDFNKKIDEKSGAISSLEKILYRFEENIEKTFSGYSPHHIVNFAYDLTSEFNKFYAETKVLDKKNEDYFYNLKVVEKYKSLMEENFNLLGIETVEKM